jgi:hypothetical protein
MKNKKTTVAGYVIVAAAVLKVIADYLTTGDIAVSINESLLPALAGAGLIGAQDGGH